MSECFEGLPERERWRLMVNAAKRALEREGYALERVPGRGLSNVWSISKGGRREVVAIRTTRDRWIAFQPLDGGKGWKTLDDVEKVVVAAVDSKDDPENVEVYIFPADEVRRRFAAAYDARAKDRRAAQDNYGMWVGLDHDSRGLAASVGSGIVDDYPRIAVYPMAGLLAEGSADTSEDNIPDEGSLASGPTTIVEVLACAREKVARLAGVQPDAVKLELRIEY